MRETRLDPASDSGDESLAGSLLLAHPVLRDAHFRRTAILMSLKKRSTFFKLIL